MLENESSTEILMAWGLTILVSLRGITESAVRGFFTDLDNVPQFTVGRQEPLFNTPSEGEPLPFHIQGKHIKRQKKESVGEPTPE